MLIANLSYIVNTLILIGYFIFYSNRTAWPEQFLWWSWLLYIAHFYLHHWADGLQNTTRNIARIYLLRRYGIDYDNGLVSSIQTALVPDSMLPMAIIWTIVHIGSFTFLLFFQGWAVALIAELVVIFFAGFIPINYQVHLKQISKYVHNLKIKQQIAFDMAGISYEGLVKLLDKAISEHLNPQEWWATVLKETVEGIQN